MSLPLTMYAMSCPDAGGPPDVMRWEKRPVPALNEGDVLIRVVCAGVNRADILQRQGFYPPPEGASPVMGLEVAGIIVAVGGGVHGWKEGDQVCALLAGGGYAEYASAPQGQCLPKPAHLSWAEAAALPEGVITVWANIFELGQLKPSETVLVHGGSSGIGTLAIAMVKHYGARIFVTAKNDEKCRLCDQLGADLSINYMAHDFVDVIQRQTQGKGVNVVLDMVGGDYIARNLSILSFEGRHISIAASKGSAITLDLMPIIKKRLILTGSTLRARSKLEKARLVNEIALKIWPWVERSELKPFIYKTLPIKNGAEAHKMMEFGQHIGKMVLEVQPTL